MKPLALSTAYATWVRAENDNQWIVRDQDGTELGRFPAKWKEKDCMIAINLGRKYELEAFNRGIDFGKEKRDQTYKPIMKKLNKDITELGAMNERLSTQLEKHIIGEN